MADEAPGLRCASCKGDLPDRGPEYRALVEDEFRRQFKRDIDWRTDCVLCGICYRKALAKRMFVAGRNN